MKKKGTDAGPGRAAMDALEITHARTRKTYSVPIFEAGVEGDTAIRVGWNRGRKEDDISHLSRRMPRL